MHLFLLINIDVDLSPSPRCKYVLPKISGIIEFQPFFSAFLSLVMMRCGPLHNDAEGQLDVIPQDCRTVSQCLMINLRLVDGSLALNSNIALLICYLFLSLNFICRFVSSVPSDWVRPGCLLFLVQQ